MKPRDWFLVGVKLFGVWLLISCVDELRYVAEIYIGTFSPSRTPVASYWIHAGLNLLVGLYLLNGAPLLTTWAFGRSVTEPACDKCGYSLQGNVSGVCPECGAQISK